MTGALRPVHRRVVLALAAAASFASQGCGPAWTVVRQAAPNPFVGQTRFTLAKPSFEGVIVGGRPEAEWKAEKPDETRASWDGDKQAMLDLFVTTLAKRALSAGIQLLVSDDPKAAAFSIRARFVEVDPGFYAFVTARQSTVRMTVQLVSGADAVVDEFTLSSSTVADMILASSGSRLRKDAERLGEHTGDYLKARTLPPSK